MNIESIDVLALQETLLTPRHHLQTCHACEAVVKDTNEAGWSGGSSDLLVRNGLPYKLIAK